MNLQATIDRIGAELVKCSDGCVGICREQKAGILPRGLYVDRPTSTGRGCLVIGLNPGKSFEITYDRVKEFYASSRFAYFTKARRVVDELGLTGPIVWSNLAKCENARGQKELPPIQTMRHCYGRFLRRELETIPREWPALALGRDVFLALAYLVPERAVIGIPHPTGARSFHTLFKQDGTLRDDLRDRAADALSAPELGAVWLGLRKERA